MTNIYILTDFTLKTMLIDNLMILTAILFCLAIASNNQIAREMKTGNGCSYRTVETGYCVFSK